MSRYDLIIRGGTVATATDTFDADVAVKDGKVAAIGLGLEGLLPETSTQAGDTFCRAASTPTPTSSRSPRTA